jgi:hypothetical protein
MGSGSSGCIDPLESLSTSMFAAGPGPLVD